MDPRFCLVDERAAVWNGRPVELEPSAESATGYLNVCYQAGRSKPFYAKAKVDEGKPRTIPGTNSTTAWEAAAKYAYFKAFWEGPLPEKQVRSKRSSSEVSARPSPAPQPALISRAACLSQEMSIKHEAKKAKREARQAAKAAKREVENAGRGQAAPATHGRLCSAVQPRGSPAPMQPMQSPLPPIAVMLGPM
jgi:hypothetical protein